MIDEQNIIQKLQHGLDEYLLKNPNEEDSEVVSIVSEIINTLKIKAEPRVAWSQIPVDTPILVSVNGVDWHNRYFASFDGNFVSAWDDGATSWSAQDNNITPWEYAKLAKSEE